MSIDDFSVLESVPGLRPAADTVSGPPEDWRAAVTGWRPPAGPDGYWPHHDVDDLDRPAPGGAGRTARSDPQSGSAARRRG